MTMMMLVTITIGKGRGGLRLLLPLLVVGGFLEAGRLGGGMMGGGGGAGAGTDRDGRSGSLMGGQGGGEVDITISLGRRRVKRSMVWLSGWK
jgi:hypothetical protein